jgi:hypothetical protein
VRRAATQPRPWVGEGREVPPTSQQTRRLLPHHSGASHRRALPDPCRGRPDPRAGWSDPRRKRAPPAGAGQEWPLPSGQRETSHHTDVEFARGGDGCGGGPHTQRSASPPPKEHGDGRGRPCPSLVELPSMVCMREQGGRGIENGGQQRVETKR